MAGEEQRTCDGCNACCVVYSFDEEPVGEKPRFATCPKVSECGGCSIYEQRPPVCRDFQCSWLAGDLPLKMAPKDVGFVITTVSTGAFETPVMNIQETRHGAFKDSAILAELLASAVRSLPFPISCSYFRDTPGPVGCQWVIGYLIEPDEYTAWRTWMLEDLKSKFPIPENPPTAPTPEKPQIVFPTGECGGDPSFYHFR